MLTWPMGYENGTSSHFNGSSGQELTSLGRAKQRSSSGGGAISRERLSECERLAGRDTQVDSETCDERKERAYGRLRASQWDIIVATRYRYIYTVVYVLWIRVFRVFRRSIQPGGVFSGVIRAFRVFRRRIHEYPEYPNRAFWSIQRSIQGEPSLGDWVTSVSEQFTELIVP